MRSLKKKIPKFLISQKDAKSARNVQFLPVGVGQKKSGLTTFALLQEGRTGRGREAGHYVDVTVR